MSAHKTSSQHVSANGRPTLLARLSGAVIPSRRRGVELLDDPAVDDALVARSLRDVALANRCLGGTAAVIGTLRPLLRQFPSRGASVTLLDVGTGLGDIPAQARRVARTVGLNLTTIGLERTAAVAAGARPQAELVCVGDGLALPFGSKSVDIITCSQVLHHFGDDESIRLLREMHRVARYAIVIADLRRSWLAAAGIWAASFALGFHPVSRHDGVLSVLRGYRTRELAQLVQRAIGTTPATRNRLGFRVTATWTPS